MRVLVTGASSLIGRATVELLTARGDHVVAFQRSESNQFTAAVEQRRGDITDSDAVSDAMTDTDAVIHLAAKVGVVGERSEYAAVNVGGTRNVIDAAQHHGVRRVVNVSSPSVAHDGTAIVGGGADPVVLDHGTGWYSETKAIAEDLALRANGDSMGVVAIRPHLVWGPGDTQLVGRIIERAQSGQLALVGGGTALIDTTYIDNAATALVCALDAVEPGSACAGRAYVVANGEPRPIRELVAGICAAAGVAFEPRDVPLAVARRLGSVVERLWPRLGRDDEPPLTRFLAEQLGTAHWFDPRPVRQELGWSPTVTIDEGLARLGDWFSEQRSEEPRR